MTCRVGTNSNQLLSTQTRNVGSNPAALDNMGNVAQSVEQRKKNKKVFW